MGISCGNYTKGMIIPVDGGIIPVIFQYNPYEFHITKDIRWKGVHVAGRDQPYLEFGCGEARVISLGIEVSRWNNSDFFVVGFLNTLLNLSYPIVQGYGVDRPSRVQLVLGASYNGTCVVDDVKVRYGSHKGQQHHSTYLAGPVDLLPREGHVIVRLLEYY